MYDLRLMLQIYAWPRAEESLYIIKHLIYRDHDIGQSGDKSWPFYSLGKIFPGLT